MARAVQYGGIMKSLRTLLLGSVALAALAVFGSTQARADYYAPGHPYTYGHNGYWTSTMATITGKPTMVTRVIGIIAATVPGSLSTCNQGLVQDGVDPEAGGAVLLMRGQSRDLMA